MMIMHECYILLIGWINSNNRCNENFKWSSCRLIKLFFYFICVIITAVILFDVIEYLLSDFDNFKNW